jgi:transposase
MIKINGRQVEMGKSTKRYTDEFKKQIVELKSKGRSTADLVREYGVTKQSVNVWVKQFANSGSFKATDNLTETEKQLKLALKENRHLRMENDILKQAALILGRKDG